MRVFAAPLPHPFRGRDSVHASSVHKTATNVHLYASRRYTYIAPRDLHTSISLCLQRAFRAPELQASSSLCLQCASRAIELHTSMPAHPRARSAPPEFHTFTSARLQRASRPPELNASMPPRRYTYSAPPDLHTSIRKVLYVERTIRSLHSANPATPMYSYRVNTKEDSSISANIQARFFLSSRNSLG